VAVAEATGIEAAVGAIETALTVVAPIAELPAVATAIAGDISAGAAQFAVDEGAAPGVSLAVLVASLAMKLIVFEVTAITLALLGRKATFAIQIARAEMPAELTIGVAAGAGAIRLPFTELPSMTETVGVFQAALAVVEVVAKLAFVDRAVLAETPVAMHAATLEFALVDTTLDIAETAEAGEQALPELTLVAIACGALPGAQAMPLAILELAEVIAAVRIVDTTAALQQAIDDFTAIATAVRQHSIGRGERLALAAGGEQTE